MNGVHESAGLFDALGWVPVVLSLMLLCLILLANDDFVC
jgi:hypothetical protein